MKFCLSLLIISCALFAQEKLTDYVDPFIGTAGHGHTYPGASLPFGMVQLSPDNGTTGWDWCSGYHYSDSSLLGFSHTHLSGTGGADYGDILLQPFSGEIKWQPGSKADPDAGYRSRFSHDRESASPGYYQVYLDDHKVNVELSATRRTGFHKYTFDKDVLPRVLLDLKHGISDQVRYASLRIVNDREIEGLRRSQGWAFDQYVYFVIRFDQPFTRHHIQAGDTISHGDEGDGRVVRAVFDFDDAPGGVVQAQVGISAVDVDGARKNLDSESADWDFNAVKESARETWEARLSKIRVSGKKDDKIIFYTALYHALLAPNLYMDVDGRYRGRDHKIHQAEGFEYYTLFSLWDTFRATHPLFTLIAADENQDFIRTMLLQYEQAGDLPIWELSANETGTMIGYHSIPVIADAFMKGQRNFDADKALKAMKNSAMRNDRGLAQFRDFGYIPSDQEMNSVSKALEYAYDDWAIAQMAKEMGQEEDYNTYIRRSQQYLNHFNEETGFMRGRLASGLWRSPFDPRKVSHLGVGDFTEGNSWQYSFFVPHQVNHLIKLMGGDAEFVAKLEELFAAEEVFGLEHTPDVSGLIGNYAHGNEPSHHIPYLYNFAGEPWRTQQIVDRIKTEMYSTAADGLAGNEDCGQMSAWYIFSSLGFYPLCPGQNEYVIGTPTFERATVDLGNGKQLQIASNRSEVAGPYIQSMYLNSRPYSKGYLKQADIANGGRLEFVLGEQPNKQLGSKKSDRARSIEIAPEHRIRRLEETLAMPPFFDDGEDLFSPTKEIRFATITPEAEIRYTLDGSDPSRSSTLYEGPFVIDRTTLVSARTFKAGIAPSALYKRQFIKVDIAGGGIKDIQLEKEPDRRYREGGRLALVDHQLGTTNFHDGNWLGFEVDNLVATIDLGSEKSIESVSGRFLRAHGAWIFHPAWVDCQVSTDGVTFTDVAKVDIPMPPESQPDEIRTVLLPLDGIKTRYIRLRAKNVEALPQWHPSAGGRSWLFVDEVIIGTK